jgi:hypothetical protein
MEPYAAYATIRCQTRRKEEGGGLRAFRLTGSGFAAHAQMRYTRFKTRGDLMNLRDIVFKTIENCGFIRAWNEKDVSGKEYFIFENLKTGQKFLVQIYEVDEG